MSETDRACDLLADLLKDGPREAAEVLAAAKNANVSTRTMQRAANMLCVVKARAAFRGGWMWRLPDDEAETPSPIKEAEPEKSAAPVGDGVTNDDIRQHCEDESVMSRKVSRDVAERAEIIAARLRKLEAGRGKVASIHAGDPRLLRWVQAGISDPDLREAYEQARYAMERSHSQAPVTVGALLPFVEKVIAEGATA